MSPKPPYAFRPRSHRCVATSSTSHQAPARRQRIHTKQYLVVWSIMMAVKPPALGAVSGMELQTIDLDRGSGGEDGMTPPASDSATGGVARSGADDDTKPRTRAVSAMSSRSVRSTSRGDGAAIPAAGPRTDGSMGPGASDATRDRFVTGSSDGEDGSSDDLEMGPVEPMEMAYTADHLAAVMKPVALTMMLASWVVANIHEPSQDAAIAEGLSVYMVFDEDPGEETGTLVGQSIINAIVIVCAICLVTFVLVACYKYRCIKCMIGYLIFASASLLGYSGGFVVMTAFAVYNVTISWPTFIFLMYNFAVVGVVAVFWQKGLPRMLTQGYLVAVSCIMAWIVVKLPEWTSWALLVALALYDLCAVLTPCGPLRALVKLAQERPEQPIPGLLYEADVGGGNRDGVRDTFASGSAPKRGSGAGEGRVKRDQHRRPEPAAASPSPANPHAIMTSSQGSLVGTAPAVSEDGDDPTLGLVVSAVSDDDDDAGAGAGAGSGPRPNAIPSPRPAPSRASVPRERSAKRRTRTASKAAFEAEGDSYVALPERGVLLASGDDTEEEDGGRSIKLGLGDFVFYSVLVSRAALFGFATFAACFVAVLMGLVGTLLLLGIFKKALPALPISIALGVTFYFTTRLLLFPMIVHLSTTGISV